MTNKTQAMTAKITAPIISGHYCLKDGEIILSGIPLKFQERQKPLHKRIIKRLRDTFNVLRGTHCYIPLANRGNK